MTDHEIRPPSLRPTTSDVGDDHHRHNPRDAWQTRSASTSRRRGRREAAEEDIPAAALDRARLPRRRLLPIPPSATEPLDASRPPLPAIHISRGSRSGRRRLISPDARGVPPPPRHRADARRRCRRRRREGDAHGSRGGWVVAARCGPAAAARGREGGRAHLFA